MKINHALKILVVEDEEFIRENLAELLLLQGYEIEIAPDGRVGIQLINEWKPDLILCDLQMPQKTGYDVIEAVRQQLRPPKIIIFTASGDRENLLKLQSLNVRFILKPFEIIRLLTILKEELHV